MSSASTTRSRFACTPAGVTEDVRGQQEDCDCERSDRLAATAHRDDEDAPDAIDALLFGARCRPEPAVSHKPRRAE